MSRKNCQGPSFNGHDATPNNRVVEVIDSLPTEARPNYGQHSQIDDVKAFKVLMKKNLPFQRPAPDLLTKIHERIDEIKE
ncbi:MAG: hypothetical protein AAF433_06920 [Bacteroidota bacterium]